MGSRSTTPARIRRPGPAALFSDGILSRNYSNTSARITIWHRVCWLEVRSRWIEPARLSRDVCAKLVTGLASPGAGCWIVFPGPAGYRRYPDFKEEKYRRD